MAQRYTTKLDVILEKKEDEVAAGAASAPNPDELEKLQPDERSWESLKPTDIADLATNFMESLADCDPNIAEACVAVLQDLLDRLESRSAVKWEHVPNIIKDIYRELKADADVSAEYRLERVIVNLTHKHPRDVVVTLLRCAPSCDRAAATMWKFLMTSQRTAEKVLLQLLRVLEDWPLHRTCTYDGDKTDVFPLAATRVLREILQLPHCAETMELHFPRLFLALLFQISFTSSQMPQEVDDFWRRCQQEGGLPTNASMFAVQTMKALLYLLDHNNVVFKLEQLHVWETLLSAETHHCAVGLLAKEMRGILWDDRRQITGYLLDLLYKRPRWRIPAMAFLVRFLDHSERQWDDCILEFVPRYLRSQNTTKRYLGLNVLHVLCKRPSVAGKMKHLLPTLVLLLQNTSGEILEMTLSMLINVVLAMDSPIGGSIAVQLCERILLLFVKDSHQVQLLSMELFQHVMKFVEDEQRKRLEAVVHQSLLPLLFQLFSDKPEVAEVSGETLLQALKFVNRRDLGQLLKHQEIWLFAECLLVDYPSRRDHYLNQALLYLENSEEVMRMAAIEFLGVMWWHLRRQQAEVVIICDALKVMRTDRSSAVSELAAEVLNLMQASAAPSSSRLRWLSDQLYHAWRRLRCYLNNAWLRFYEYFCYYACLR